MFTNSNIQVSHTFTIKGLIPDSTHWNLQMTPEVRSLGIWSLKWRLLPNLVLFLNTICNLQQLKMFSNDLFNFVLNCKYIEPRYGRTKKRGFFSIVRIVSFTICMLSINFLKHLFIKSSEKPFLRKFLIDKIIHCVIESN